MIKREIVAEGEDEEEEAEGSMTTYEAAVGGAMNPKRLEHIVHAVRNVVNDVKSIVDEAHAIASLDDAMAAFERAAHLAATEADRRFLEQQIEALADDGALI